MKSKTNFGNRAISSDKDSAFNSRKTTVPSSFDGFCQQYLKYEKLRQGIRGLEKK